MSPVQPEPGLPEPVRPVSGFPRAISSWIGRLAAVMAILLILYVGLLLAARTEGFRSLMAQRWQKQWGVPLQIVSSALTPALELRLRGITTPEPPPDVKPTVSDESAAEAPQPKLQAKEVRLIWSLLKFKFTRIQVKGARIDFALDPDQGWLPESWARGAEQADAMTGWSWMPKKMSRPAPPHAWPRLGEGEFTIQDLDIFWHASADGPVASVEKIFMNVTPLHPPGRTLTHVRLGARACRGEDGIMTGPFEAEWILYEGGCVRLGEAMNMSEP